jgi:hypothetical protein
MIELVASAEFRVANLDLGTQGHELTPLPRVLRILAIVFLAILLTIASFAQGSKKPAPFTGKSEPITFVETTSRLHISLPVVAHSSLPISIPQQDFSLDYARRVLIPAIGGSIAVGDFDGDGLADLYVTVPGGSNHLLQQHPDGTFSDVTENAGVKGSGADLASVFADFDRTGHPSLFVAGLGGVSLYRNNGDRTFTDISAKAGLKGKPGELATSVLLFDADGDGFLDLMVTVYSDLGNPPAKSSFTFPNDFAGTNSRLYRNQRDGTFVDITESAGLADNPGRTHMALAADFNENGEADLLLLRDNKPPALFRNQGHGKFEDKTWDAGKDIWKYAYVQGQIADFHRDGKPDVVLWSTIGNEVLISQGDGKFEQDESFPLVYAANRPFGFHGLAADLTDSGYADILTVDKAEQWHVIVNKMGHFEESSLRWTAEAGSTDAAHGTVPAFVSLKTVHIGKATKKIALIGVTADGGIRMFEPEPLNNTRGQSNARRK